jgi:hypothetical protein
VGSASLGRVLFVWGGGGYARYFNEGPIYSERNEGTSLNIYFGRHFVWLKYDASFIL